VKLSLQNDNMTYDEVLLYFCTNFEFFFSSVNIYHTVTGQRHPDILFFYMQRNKEMRVKEIEIMTEFIRSKVRPV
jgi:hypothetical protein